MNQQRRVRRGFTREEDRIIIDHISNAETIEDGYKNAAQELNRTYQAVFFRYKGYLMPWSEEEDKMILQLARQLHCNWKEIQKHMGYRKSRNIKKRYDYLTKDNKNKFEIFDFFTDPEISDWFDNNY